jgi:long-chain acyl-CoA synthetase
MDGVIEPTTSRPAPAGPGPEPGTTGPRSLSALLLDRIAASPDHDAYRFPAPGAAGGWRSLTYREFGERVRRIACGLAALGLEREERGAILSSTRIEWILADAGILAAGGATTTVYPSSTAAECVYILRDSDSRFVFAEDREQAAKLQALRFDLPRVRRVILLEGAPDAALEGAGDWVLPLAEVEELGRLADERDPGAYERRIAGIGPRDLATLIYTSGTTGQPKGVELTHDNWLYTAEAIEAIDLLRPADLQYLWLPLSHSFGKVLEAAQFRIGFTTAIDGRVDQLVANLAAVQPTFVAAVPRVFEKVRARVIGGAREAGGLKARLFQWALGIGMRHSAAVRGGERPGAWLRARHALADRLVFARLRRLFGGRLRFFVSGSAPLPREVSEFFHAVGVLILEGYGLTESSAASFVNRPAQWRLGTVGLPVPGTEVRIAADGEILIRGRGNLRGYRGLPDATREALADGWLRTGDIGELDADGFLRITDRKKDLIKTAGGKYVAPQPLEGKLKLLSPLVGQAIVHGDGRAYCTALVALDGEMLRKWAKGRGLDGSYAELAARGDVHALVEKAIGELNATLPSYSTIKKFAVLPAELTPEGGELTPSLKVKRRAVERKYHDLLDGMYPRGE